MNLPRRTRLRKSAGGQGGQGGSCRGVQDGNETDRRTRDFKPSQRPRCESEKLEVRRVPKSPNLSMVNRGDPDCDDEDRRGSLPLGERDPDSDSGEAWKR